MAKQVGRGLLVQVDISGTYTNVCAMNQRSFTMNNAKADVTTPDNTTPTGIVLAEFMYGVQSVEVDGTCVYDDTAGYNAILTAWRAQTTPTIKVTVPGDGAYVFAAIVEQITMDGDKEGAVTGKLKLASSGSITFTAA